MGLLLLFALILQQAPAAPPDRVDRAMQLIHEEKYEMAYQALMDVVKDDPTNARAFPFLAAMELQTGRLAEAENHIAMLVAHEPDNVDLHELSAQLYMAKRDWKKAEEQWRWLVDQRPNSAQGHMQLAASLLQEDRFNDALAEVSRALEIAPRRSDARSLRGNILASLGQINQAALDWNIALVVDPDDTVALSGLAVFLRQSDPERALKYAYHAVELTNWKSLGPMRVLAMVYRARGENDLAKKTLERAMVLFPNNPSLAAEMRGGPDPANTPVPPAAAKPEKPAAATSKPATSAPPPAKSVATIAAAPPTVKPEPPKPSPDAVVIPPLATGGLTLGAAVGDLLPFDTLPSPPLPVKIAETRPAPTPTPVETKPAESTPVAKAVAPPKPETKPPVATAPPPVVAPPVAKPMPPPTISADSISPLAFGGLTIGASFSDLIALERLPAPPDEKPRVVAEVPAPPPARTAESQPAPALKPATKESPAINLHWGQIPLSAISPAFVYGDVPVPVERRP